ncbi:protein of unknown function [uncultured Sphingopyxis sp.]|uniref:SCP2 domain-containing protein n=1 Tax=uncultured Sphingopyxis sp. TaxID=310581 RepID=A0A1Y5PS94_9SPHN|nr:hypothetical protein [uncultured Sphingopyxis sp.]SBV32868.1 protein of unknown function [uncultured Sphingopyxis sp.]
MTMIFAGPQWIERIKELLARLVTENSDRLAGHHFSLSETFTSVPPDGGTSFWAARIEGGKVRFGDAPDPDADFALVAEQTAALPGAMLIYDGATEQMLKAANDHRRAMIAAGRMTIRVGSHKAPEPIMAVLRELHDSIAKETAV